MLVERDFFVTNLTSHDEEKYKKDLWLVVPLSFDVSSSSLGITWYEQVFGLALLSSSLERLIEDFGTPLMVT